MNRVIVGLLCGIALWAPARADEPAATNATPKQKTVRLLTIGNSFSKDATRFLPQIVAADGRFELISDTAYKGGCSLQTHWELVSTNGGKATPYAGKNLRQLLESQPWDIVTIQQVSTQSYKVETYQPYANELVKYIHTYAPQAEIWMHETWAYRADDTITYTKGVTQPLMHERLRRAYHEIARQTGISNIIPVGDAFQAAARHPDWASRFPDPAFDYKNPVYPNLPDQTHSLNIGYFWKKNAAGKQILQADTHHASKAGQYLGAAVWFERLFGASIVGNAFVPGGGGITTNEVRFLQAIAHETVADPANNKP